MENAMQPTVSSVNHIWKHSIAFVSDYEQLQCCGSTQRKCKMVPPPHFFCFYFSVFRLHTNELGAFVLIALLLNLTCVRWRPGKAGMRPKVVRYKWLSGASGRKWDCDKKQCKQCRLAERRPWMMQDSVLCVCSVVYESKATTHSAELVSTHL